MSAGPNNNQVKVVVAFIVALCVIGWHAVLPKHIGPTVFKVLSIILAKFKNNAFTIHFSVKYFKNTLSRVNLS